MLLFFSFVNPLPLLFLSFNSIVVIVNILLDKLTFYFSVYNCRCVVLHDIFFTIMLSWLKYMTYIKIKYRYFSYSFVKIKFCINQQGSSYFLCYNCYWKWNITKFYFIFLVAFSFSFLKLFWMLSNLVCFCTVFFKNPSNF